MKNFNITTLSNGIKIILKENPNTPRVAINMFINSGIKVETIPGMSGLAARLLLQGTKKLDAEALANELDENAIDMNAEARQDYTKIRAVCLNEDLGKTIELLSDIVLNSTFEKFNKELKKLKGELEVDLDSPKVKAIDNLVKNIYPSHPYGNSHTKILDSLNLLTKDNIKEYYFSNLSTDNINFVVVGSFDRNQVLEFLEKAFSKIEKKIIEHSQFKEPNLSENKKVTIAQKDASQAQIIQGWIVPNILHPDYSALAVLNTISGSSGLSSRLFVELRDKKGLAYTVRSSYEALKLSGNFTVYIGTAPVNIKTALEGFMEEIRKLQAVAVEEKELNDAKNNILGKRAFFQETNSQQAHFLGFYDIVGLGVNYDEIIKENIKKVTAEDVQRAAQKYLSGNSIISILAPEEFL